MSDSDESPKRGAGNPRLIFATGGEGQTRAPQPEYPLVNEITTIGSAEDADLRLDGLEEYQAEIRHDEDDEYIYIQTGPSTGSAVHGRPDEHAVLRTGARIELGPWTLSYFREEFADRGRNRRTGDEG